MVNELVRVYGWFAERGTEATQATARREDKGARTVVHFTLTVIDRSDGCCVCCVVGWWVVGKKQASKKGSVGREREKGEYLRLSTGNKGRNQKKKTNGRK